MAANWVNKGEVKLQGSQRTVLQFAPSIDYTGVGNYARWVSDATGSFSNLYVLKTTRKKGQEGQDRVIHPMNLPLGSGYNFSTRFPKIAYYKALSNIIRKERLSDHRIITHYLTSTIPYIGPSNDIVTVHDIIPIK